MQEMEQRRLANPEQHSQRVPPPLPAQTTTQTNPRHCWERRGTGGGEGRSTGDGWSYFITSSRCGSPRNSAPSSVTSTFSSIPI